ncbi:hypothetical protein NUACC21_53710 [Scytonema sp. NUACC21]
MHECDKPGTVCVEASALIAPQLGNIAPNSPTETGETPVPQDYYQSVLQPTENRYIEVATERSYPLDSGFGTR